MWIKDKVKTLIEEYLTNDPFEIADYKNITVYFHPLHEEIMGYYKYIRRNKFIVINSDLNNGLKLFTVAHELAHSELHPKLSTPFLKRKTLLSVDKIENEANRFAVELLLPDEVIYEHANTNLSISELSKMFQIPEEILRLKKFEFL
ncbi:ImmA/IrrE family metallo-endopeptidase [Bacillus sp. IITD106]|nr:ImmA/IrrE family metallo-endopeptidase [Bacillus sp. IITD106]